jgi:glycosyltransferase involved in cell wall biosynthesis
MEKLSVIIITKNEENNIERCLQSVSWADEIVVLDSHSTDRTLEICRKYNCRTVQTEWLGFGQTKQKAVDMASNSWIFSIDADEEAGDGLKKYLQQILTNDAINRFDGYRIKRQSWYLTGWIKYSGWNKDYPLRLFNKQRGVFNSNLVHESVMVKGKVTKIEEILYHYAYPDLQTYLRKMHQYGFLGADQKHAWGKSSSVFRAILHGFTTFVQMYFLKLGFLDGKNGLILAINSAFGVYIKYLVLWEKSLRKGKKILDNPCD